MSAAQIQKRIQAGLKRAQKKTGSPTADKVYLVSKTIVAGTPLAPGTSTSTNIELTNAIFIDYDAKHFKLVFIRSFMPTSNSKVTFSRPSNGII